MSGMQPGRVEIDGLDVVGLEARTTNEAEAHPGEGKIPGLWQQLHADELALRTPSAVEGQLAGVYGEYESDQTGSYSVVVGPVVRGAGSAPEGLRHVHVPAGPYLVFPVEGELPMGIVETWGRIWEYFAGDVEWKRVYTWDFEWYRPEGVEIYVAIE